MRRSFLFNRQPDPYGTDESVQPRGIQELAYEGNDEGIAGLSELYSPEDSVETRIRDVADIMLECGTITAETFSSVRQQQSINPSCDLTELLMDCSSVKNDDIIAAKATLYGLEFQRISPEDIDKDAFEKMDIESIKDLCIMPIAVEDNMLVVATSDPGNIFATESVKNKVHMNLQVVACCPEDIQTACDFFHKETSQYDVDDIISDMTDVEVIQEEDKDLAEDLEKMAGQSPVIKFVNYLVSNAIREGASDVHIEPKDKFTKIRYRIDGVLFEMMQSPPKMHPAIVSRIKVMANLDISERRLPQDGKVSVIVGGREVDLRISTLPTSSGEKVVIRVLDSKSILRGLDELGMQPRTQDTFYKQVQLPHGVMLVTGPTGSGKSTTLYTALNQMDGDTLNISTVEDPVEYRLGFCNQVQANEKIGLTFAAALRSLLRQDPDVMMIGEIRDQETAAIAVQAALTGHLVLSTLHTNDAASSITRLVNIGVDSYLIAASLNAVLAQRLVRRICQNCKTQYDPPERFEQVVEATGLRPDQIFHGAGCDNCRNSGYAGRVGIYELLLINDPFRDMINTDPSVTNMRLGFKRSGEPTLFDDGIWKVKEGLTTLDEVLRVTQAQSNVHRALSEGLVVEEDVQYQPEKTPEQVQVQVPDLPPEQPQQSQQEQTGEQMQQPPQDQANGSESQQYEDQSDQQQV